MPKLSIDNQNRVRAYLQNLHELYGVSIIITVCGTCGEWTGVKSGVQDGHSSYGVSHGYCPKCLAEEREKIRTRKL